MEEGTIKIVAQVVGQALVVSGNALKNLGDALDQNDSIGCSPVPMPPAPLVGGVGNTLKVLGNLIDKCGFDM